MQYSSSLIAAAIALTAAEPVLAQSWAAPFVITPTIADQFDALAIDPNGNAVVLWTGVGPCGTSNCLRLYSRALVAGGAWGAAAVVTATQPSFGQYIPTLNMSDIGTADAIWFDSSGLPSATKPLGRAWSAPLVLVSNAGFTGAALGFDHAGDSAVVLNGITVKYKAHGGAWTDLGSVVPAGFVDIVGTGTSLIAVSASGDVAVAWVSYKESCYHHHCTPYDFRQHVSRLPSGTKVWQSVDITPLPQIAGFVMDDAGRIGMVANSTQDAVFYGQSSSGLSWNAAVDTASPGSMVQVQTDGAGDITIMTTQNGTFPVATGKMAGGAWVGYANPYGNYVPVQTTTFALPGPSLSVSASGSAILGWAYATQTGPSSYNYNIVAATRPSASASFAAPSVRAQSSGGTAVELLGVSAASGDRDLLAWFTFPPSGARPSITAELH